jgi:hypothetical protein
MEIQRPVTPPLMIAIGTDIGEDILEFPAVGVIVTAMVATIELGVEMEMEMVFVGYLSRLIVYETIYISGRIRRKAE